uniref:Uncharacterized protein n=1 Tax=Arundo donax TaxID=35708 RepID=A0A0A9FI01_ARUDO
MLTNPKVGGGGYQARGRGGGSIDGQAAAQDEAIQGRRFGGRRRGKGRAKGQGGAPGV